MTVKALLKVDGEIRKDVRVDCDVKRGYCTGMITERNGYKLRLPQGSQKRIVLEDGQEFEIIVGSSKYYDTLVFISEPIK